MHKIDSTRQVEILGLPFSRLSVEALVAELPSGGLLVAPAAPALATLPEDPAYREALDSATWIIPDSGFMVLLWNICHRTPLKRCSGLKLFSAFITQQGTDTGKLFCINPSPQHSSNNQQWLIDQGIEAHRCQHYDAPYYNQRPITDSVLREMLEKEKPAFILINLGGGTQELLGSYLIKTLSYKPAILCTGAAIAFHTGDQAKIPPLADKLYLGWLLRILHSPKQYLPRYVKALKLPLILMRSRSRNPGSA